MPTDEQRGVRAVRLRFLKRPWVLQEEGVWQRQYNAIEPTRCGSLGCGTHHAAEGAIPGSLLPLQPGDENLLLFSTRMA